MPLHDKCPLQWQRGPELISDSLKLGFAIYLGRLYIGCTLGIPFTLDST